MSKNNVVHIDFTAHRKRKKNALIRYGVQAWMNTLGQIELKRSIVLRMLAVIGILILSMLFL